MADTWTPISGYTPQDYTDTAVFEVNPDTKKIALITGQALVAGEENSQYIKFVLDRYWDGIDIKDKAFYVEYALAGTYYGKTAAVNAEYTTEQVRFGWIVPKEACCISGTLLFVLRIESTDYVLKTQIAEHPVFRSVNVEDVVPEPTKEAWYREFEARVETAIEDAETALTAAQAAQTAAENAALNAQTSEENAETAAASAQTRYGSPLTAAEADEMIEQNRVYVYVGSETGYTNGHWYYYNGSEWADGGVYNGSAVNTDTTLTQSGMAADAKATGDEISQIKEDLQDIAESSNNLFDGNVVNLGFSSGKVASDPTYRAFYWPVSNGETYTLSRRNTTDFNRFRVGFLRTLPEADVLVYKDDGTQFTPTSAGDSLTVQTVTVPSNHEYAYAMVYLSNSGQTIDDSCRLMINKGSTALEWEAYFEKTAVDKVAREKIAEFDGNVGIIQRNGIAETTNKLQQLNRPTRTGGHTLGTAPLCFLHFSDIHGDKKRLQNIIEFKEYYSDYIADIIHTGDMVRYYSTDGITFWDEVEGAENILNVIGNHDTLVGSTWIGMTMAEAYTTYFAPYISNWGVVSTSGNTYYYKDYTDNKVRLIVLDIMHQSADQLSWFVSTLASARTAELHVIVAVHSRAHWQFTSHQTAWDDKPLVPSYTAGYSDTSASTYPENLSDDYADAVDDFMTAGGFFVCWIHGHTHHKMFAELQTHPNQLDVSVENAGIPNFAWTYVKARIENTKSEDCFNVFAVDVDSKVLRIMTVGATYDRFMRHADTIAYNYDTHTLLT